MSRSTARQRREQAALQQTIVLMNARIHQIRRIDNKVLVALARDMHPDHFPEECVPKKLMEIQTAKRVWNTNPRYLTQAMPDSKKDGGGGGDEGDDVDGVLESDMPDVEDFIGEVDASARESHNAEKHDMLKRHGIALTMRGEMLVSCVEQGRQTFYLVSGEWCTASRAVPLYISGYKSGTSKFRGTDILSITAYHKREQQYGIWPAAIGRVTARDFDRMLDENRQFPLAVRQNFIIDLFGNAPAATAPAVAAAESPRVMAPTPAPVVVPSRFALNAAGGGGNQVQAAALRQGAEARATQYTAALDRELPHATLLARIVSQKKSPHKMLRAPFAELSLRLMMINEYLVFVREYYNRDTHLALSLVARGESPVPPTGVAALPVAPGPAATERRGIDELCRNECIAIVYFMLLYEPHVLCFRPMRKRVGEQRHQPWLALLPDLSLESYRRLQSPGVRRTPNAAPVHIAVAVDLYHSIIMADVKQHDDGTGVRQAGGDGHMFTVFGIDERDTAETFYHQRGFAETPETLRAVDTLGQHGSFALPPPGTGLTPAERRLLRNDRTRLAGGESSASSDEFAEALQWLVAEQVLVRERHIGTGRYNLGKAFDAFQSVDMYEEQTSVVELLIDIYRRGAAQRTISLQRLVTPVDPALYAHYGELAEKQKMWAREYDPAVIESREKRIALKLQSATVGQPTAQPPAPGVLLRALARDVANYDALARQRYAALGARAFDGEENDAYADARTGREHRVPPLMLGAMPPPVLANGRPLAEEQMACMRRIMEQAIVQPVGRGGVGKSELVRYLTLCYPQQIVLTAFTGNATSELTRRTGVKARTIHSLLFGHTRFREARIRTAAYRRYMTAKQRRAGGDGRAKPVEQYTLEDVVNCTDDYVLRAYIEEHVGAIPPLTSPFPAGGSVLVIDEMSLVSFKLFYRLLRAAHCPVEGRYVSKLILLGDLDQLPSVDFGNVQSDIAHGFPDSVHELVVNHRSEGTELFQLAQAIAEHRHPLPMPAFDVRIAGESLSAVQRPPPLVSFQCYESDVESRINYVYSKLGAFSTDALGERPRLRAIQTIAMTNPEIDTANETIRWGLFRRSVTEDEPRARALQVVRRDSANDDNNVEDGEAAQRHREEAQRVLATRVMVGDRIFLTRNQRADFRPTAHDPEPREKLFFNSRLLEAVQFYNAPIKIMANTWCRCGLCPARQDGMPENYVSPCLLRRDLVPPERRGLDIGNSAPLRFHNDCTQYLGGNVCRIGVFRDQSGDYIEFNVMRMLGQGAVPSRTGGFTPYARGFAMTVHKMQGAQQSIVCFLASKPSRNFGWRAVYTAATRAQHRLIVLSTDSRFCEFVYRVEPIRRSSLWYHLSKAVDSLCNKPTNRSITARWNEFECRRYRTDVAAEQQQQPVLSDDNDDDEVFSGQVVEDDSEQRPQKRARYHSERR